MAYHWNITDTAYVEFALAPLLGTLDALTVAVFFKRTTVSSSNTFISFNNSGLSAVKADFRAASSDKKPYWFDSANFPNGSQVMSSTSTWYLLVFTKAAGTSAACRFHVHDGTSWVHAAGSSGASPFTTVSGDHLRVGLSLTTQNPFDGDIVCIGVKKADSADLTVENLSRTAFSAWRSFGFDWLIGFDSSLISGGLLQDQSSAGTGDQTGISAAPPSAVSDPAGWAWAAAVAPVADFTGTPLSGTEPLSVAFTDTSTNTPTSWAWTFGDGGTSSSQNPSHSYAAAGTYTVVLVATNAAGSNTKTRTGYVTVADQPRPIRINTSQGWAEIGDATSFVSGTGAPTAAAGATGAIYLDTATGLLYGPKAAGAWPGTPIALAAGNVFNFPTAIAASSASNSTLFRDSADNKLKFKDSGGTVNALY